MKRELKLSLLVFAIGVFMAALDNGIITAALTTLTKSFHVSATWGAWSITVYTLGLAISVPIIGKLSDRYGRKTLFMVEATLFGLGSLFVALSPTFTWFLIARFFQSMGGGGIYIIASSFVLNTFPKEKQGQTLGMLGGMNGIASVLGPNIGSFILGVTGSWHWLFLINVPIAALLVLFGAKYIHEKQILTQSRMDWVGVTALSLAMLSMMYGFTNLDGVNFIDSLTSASFLGFFGAGVALLIFLYFVEKRVEKSSIDPILPTYLFKDNTFRWTLVFAMFSGSIIASIIFVPGFVEQYLGVSSTVSGYWFTPLALASGIGAALGGRLVDKKGSVFTLLIASSLAAIGFLLFSLWVTTKWEMVFASVLVGVGFGSMIGAPVNVLAAEKAGANKGVALSTTSLARQVGLTLAPTFLAGFIARSYMNMGNVIQSNMKAANIVPAGSGVMQMPAQMDFNSLQASFQHIQDPTVKQVMIDSLHQVAGNGYGGLFTTSAMICAVCIMLASVIGVVRKKQKNHQVNAELNVSK
ncbi:MFS transporter [Paenibacillus azoreducens]|uniref:MFS transporter n=1 Tax=Paenibacillus azoreducens TaxID=116718 RepID=UPI0039F461C7